MLCFLAESPVEQREMLSKKEKRKLVFPFCCLRYRCVPTSRVKVVVLNIYLARPSKPYFLFTVKWSVMQVSIFCSQALGLSKLRLTESCASAVCDSQTVDLDSCDCYGGFGSLLRYVSVAALCQWSVITLVIICISPADVTHLDGHSLARSY